MRQSGIERLAEDAARAAKISCVHASDYTYHFDDAAIDRFNEVLENRIGDSSGFHEEDFFDTLDLLLALNRDGSCLDVGAGVGRITSIARDSI